MPFLAPAARTGRAGSGQLVVRSRHELLRHMRAFILHVAPEWGPEGCTTIVLTSTSLGLSEVQAAFDELDEKYHVDGVDLCVEQRDRQLRVILRARTLGGPRSSLIGHCARPGLDEPGRAEGPIQSVPE